MTELSILIPARNELFLNETVENILANIELDTEVVITLDGAWPHKPIPIHDRVRILYLPESIGQRAATNIACRTSDAEYVAKCDAHCAFGKGFDRILIEDMRDDWTMVPLMKNLHAFNWKCKKCGNEWYQGPTPMICQKATNRKGNHTVPSGCDGTEFERKIYWKPNDSPNSTSMRFDRDMKFQYWGQYKKKQEGDLVETMSLLGAFWLMRRDRYWKLNICDEGHGSWGQQGTEVSAKSWLSGGKLICSKKTWFAHMFRTQGGDFGFPYKLSGKDVRKARDYSKNLWLNNNWDQAKYPLEWLIKKFEPPEWEDIWRDHA